jgi:hypothetical protein
MFTLCAWPVVWCTHDFHAYSFWPKSHSVSVAVFVIHFVTVNWLALQFRGITKCYSRNLFQCLVSRAVAVMHLQL